MQTLFADGALAKMTQEERDAHWKKPEDERIEELTNEVNRLKGVKREVVVKGLAGASALGFLAANGLIFLDQRTRDQRTRKDSESGRDTPSRLEVLDEWKDWYPPKDGEPLPNESILTFGGLGCVNSWSHAHPMAVEGFGLPQESTTPMSFLVSSLKGKKIPEIADLIEQAAEKSGSLSFYGQSNGSVVILEALRYLKEKKNVVIPINRFILNCSPFGFGDAKVNYIEEYLSKFLVGTNYTPGTIGQFLWLLRENWTIDRAHLFDSLLDAVEKSWERAQEGEPPGPWIADLRTLVRSRLDEYDFEGIITKNTKMLFLSSDNDDIVYNESSIPRFRALAEKYGAEFTVEDMPPGTRHADSVVGSKKAKPWIRRDRRDRVAF